MEAEASGRLVEVFGTGTAVVIQPIKSLLLPSGQWLKIPYDEAATLHWSGKAPGSSKDLPTAQEPKNLTGRVYRALLDIQYGYVEHENWSVVIE